MCSLMRKAKKGPYEIGELCRPCSAPLLHVGSGQGFSCPLIESTDTVVYGDEQ